MVNKLIYEERADLFQYKIDYIDYKGRSTFCIIIAHSSEQAIRYAKNIQGLKTFLEVKNLEQ